MVYVHVPFCGRFCTYCDFYSEILCAGRDTGRYVDEVCSEICRRSAEIKDTEDINTLYIGGGTPSVLPLSDLSRIAAAVRGAVDSGFKEFTVEVNPDDIVSGGVEYASGLRSIGVSRISMGVQSLDDGMLRWMNRRHGSREAREAFGILREAGFDNISLDVISGISHMTDSMLEDTLKGLIAMSPEHISAYQLSVEEGSALAGMISSGRYTEASEDQCRRQYLLICSLLRDAGYVHYEISNWARPGFEAVHNSAYWRRAPYVGVGPAAHSLRIEPGKQVRSWNSSVLTGWTPSSEVLSGEEIREEEIMLGLRTARGWNGRHLTEEEWFVSDGIISDILAQS